jgi:hypothetical protein
MYKSAGRFLQRSTRSIYSIQQFVARDKRKHLKKDHYRHRHGAKRPVLGIITEYAKRGGPLPRRGTGIGSAFWRGYEHPAARYGYVPGSIADWAQRAGRARVAAEPGLGDA